MDKEKASSEEFRCVGKLEIMGPKPVGFLCGSIPVPTDKAFHHFASALVPSPNTVSAPRYRMLPTETDLNMPPLLSHVREKVLPIAVAQSKTRDLPWESGALASNLTRKGEALAVSGLAEYGDETDVIAPADILKQIFKMPYSKARLSIAVHRVGQTLVLNTGPDIEEGEKLVRRHKKNQSNGAADQSLFLNFAMHSVRVEACDCPPAHNDAQSEEQSSNSPVLPGRFQSSEGSFESSDHPGRGGHTFQFFGQSGDIAQEEEELNHQHHHPEFPQVKQDNSFIWGSKTDKSNNKGHNAAVRKAKASQFKEKRQPRCSMQESEKYRRCDNEGFLRVLFWQFHNFRMLLGSDLLLFSNEKYVAVSLHLWDVSRQVTPLTWLEAWLDNVMASVPELAICYHQDGVVQGYELLKTDDIFLLKGISEDGTPAFHPHFVQQNGLSVLRFLQENCKQDPGAYWLYKGAGEDVIQLFDLSVIPKNHSSNDCDDNQVSLPSLIHRGRSDSVLSLGTLLYRIAHRLSLSMSPNNKARCARFFKQCLDFLDEPDHLVVRALAHEQFARLLLNYDEELDLASEVLPVESGISVVDVEEEPLDFFNSVSESIGHEMVYYSVGEGEPEPSKDGDMSEDSGSEVSLKSLDANISASETLLTPGKVDLGAPGVEPSFGYESFEVRQLSTTAASMVQNVGDPISSKLAAVHHVSQAIKSLRWRRQLQNTESEQDHGSRTQDIPPPPPSSSIDFSVCACGDADCIEVCDIRQWLPTSKLDDKLWKLVLLLGESYLALGQAYKDDSQLGQALKVVELASLLYGSMPQHLEDTTGFISSMVRSLSVQVEINDTSSENSKTSSIGGDVTIVNSSSSDGRILPFEQHSSTYLFWAKAWTLVGDVYVELNVIKGKEITSEAKRTPCGRELRMSSEVLKEVKRLKKKLGQFNQNCSSCSLVNCSCQSDRASSGSSASTTGDSRPIRGYGRKKQGKKSYVKSSPYEDSSINQNNNISGEEKIGNTESGGCLKQTISDDSLKQTSSTIMSDVRVGHTIGGTATVSKTERTEEDTMEMHDTGLTWASSSENASKKTTSGKIGGIFKYVRGPLMIGHVEYNLSTALSCYEEARKALGGHPSGSGELQSVVKKKGWVCNELGRTRLERKELDKAELAFADAINSFRQVSDHTNIILINCNLGHGRRALAEEMVLKLETLKQLLVLQSTYKQGLETAKLEYGISLRYYLAAKTELNTIAEAGCVPSSLRNEVYTQVAHTYLRLGMFLAKEDTVAEIYENGNFEDSSSPSNRKAKKELSKYEISANDAIREALSMYESLGEFCKQEAAYAYFQLACYQRDCCLKFLDLDQKKSNLSKGENSVFQRAKQYASLAERNWQKSIDFYGPKTHSNMYLTILMERSSLLLSLSNSFHSNTMLESSLARLLEGCHIPPPDRTIISDPPQIFTNFWTQLQMLLKNMLATALSANTNRSSLNSQHQTPSNNNRSVDVGRLRELYKMSLKSTDFTQLHAMHSLWTSSSS